MSEVKWLKRHHYNDSNNPLWYETPFVNKQKHGVEKIWYYDGKPQFEICWDNGKKHGLTKVWYSTGQVLSETNYFNGAKHGKCIKYEKNGSVITTSYYLNGKEVSEEDFRRYELICELSGIKDE